MEEDLISKKELLELTGISYGQLYRWKRKNIIPEEWFIKKSSFTGQETYFPKEKILERIGKIMELKDDRSLDELAEQFSLKPADLNLTAQELIDKKIVKEMPLKLYKENFPGNDNYEFIKVLEIFLLNNLLESGAVTIEEGIKIIKTYKKARESKEEKPLRVIYLRKYGMGITIIGSMPFDFTLDDEVKIPIDIDIAREIEDLKLKLK